MYFYTSKTQIKKIPEIAQAMIKVGINELLVEKFVKKAEECQGTFELMELWLENPADLNRDTLIEDLKECIDEKPVNVWTFDILNCDENK